MYLFKAKENLSFIFLKILLFISLLNIKVKKNK